MSRRPTVSDGAARLANDLLTSGSLPKWTGNRDRATAWKARVISSPESVAQIAGADICERSNATECAGQAALERQVSIPGPADKSIGDELPAKGFEFDNRTAFDCLHVFHLELKLRRTSKTFASTPVFQMGMPGHHERRPGDGMLAFTELPTTGRLWTAIS